MKSLGSPHPWPPEACDELRQHLGRYGWAHRRENVVDDLHDLLDELDEWLADGRTYTTRRARRDEWSSLKDDLVAAWNHAGTALQATIPTMPTLLARLHPDLGLDQPERAALRIVLKAARTEARRQEAAGAAFDDLVLAVQDPNTRSDLIAGRVDILDSVLRFGDRALADVVRDLNGILNNDSWYVAIARHVLEGDALPDFPIPDEDAGMSEADRIALGRRWITYVPPPAHRVVWLFYGSARLDHWRLRIGPCEFFSGDALLAAMAEVDEIRGQGGEYPGNRDPFRTVPEELQDEAGWGSHIRDPKEWPDEEHWVAVRVDLGIGRFPNLEQTARDQAEAIMALATFAQDGTTWRALTGYRGFKDGEQSGYSVPFREPGAERRWVQTDLTYEWLHRNADQVGTHVLTAPDAHAVVQAASALNAADNASASIQILEAVRSIETQAIARGVHWKTLIETHVIPGSALTEAQSAAFNAISDLSGGYDLYPELPHIHGIANEFFEPIGDGLVNLKVGEAFIRLCTLVEDLPTYHRSARRIREILADLDSPVDALAHIDRLRSLDERLLNRAARVRNCLTHGGPQNEGILKTAASFIVPKAKQLAGTTLRALLDGKPFTDGPDEYQQAVDAWLARFPGSADTFDALYGPPNAGSTDSD